jgi:beta-alanine degradation protein BauB
MDPTVTDPDKYVCIFENPRVRVLAYTDSPGEATHAHAHPDSVMITLSGFRRRLTVGDLERDVVLEPGEVRWLDAQEHRGENIGESPTQVIFVELKEPRPQDAPPAPGALGPS